MSLDGWGRMLLSVQETAGGPWVEVLPIIFFISIAFPSILLVTTHLGSITGCHFAAPKCAGLFLLASALWLLLLTLVGQLRKGQ